MSVRTIVSSRLLATLTVLVLVLFAPQKDARAQERDLQTEVNDSIRDIVGYLLARDADRARLALARFEFVLEAIKHPPRTAAEVARYERERFELECQEILRTELTP